MIREITFFNRLMIGIDTDNLVFGLGTSKDKEDEVRIFGIMFLWFFLIIELPMLKKHNKQHTFQTINHSQAKVNGVLYNLVPHRTFKPEIIYIRLRQTGDFEIVERFTMVKTHRFDGYLVQRKTDSNPTFYRMDEVCFFEPIQMIKGYIDNNSNTIKVLSLVD